MLGSSRTDTISGDMSESRCRLVCTTEGGGVTRFDDDKYEADGADVEAGDDNDDGEEDNGGEE